MSIEQMLTCAVARHQAGDFAEAEAIYLRVLETDPENPDALHLLGLVAHQFERNQVAVDLLNRAITARPDFYDALNNLGLICRKMSQLDDAINAYRRAIEVRPEHGPNYSHLIDTLRETRRFDQAIQLGRRGTSLAPNSAMAHCDLANALSDGFHLYEATAEYRKAIELDPKLAIAHNNLGTVLNQRGMIDSAIECYQMAITIDPSFALPVNNLGAALLARHDFEAALPLLRKAVSLQPDSTDATRNIGLCLLNLNRATEAIALLEQAVLSHTATFDEASDLVKAYEQCNRLADASKLLRQLMELQSDNPCLSSRLIRVLQADPCVAPAVVQAEKTKWRMRYASLPRRNRDAYRNPVDPSRRIRIGYLINAPHPAFESLLASHNRDEVELFVYCNIQHVDPLARHMQRHADRWQRIAGRSDQLAVDTIIADQIDILIDTCGHSAHHRLLVMAMQPAPLQIWQAGCELPREAAMPSMADLSSADISQEARRLERTYRALWQEWCRGAAASSSISEQGSFVYGFMQHPVSFA